MTPIDDIRRGLRAAATHRDWAKDDEQAALQEMADWAIQARQSMLPMREAAELLGMSRDAVYDLIAWREGRKPTRA